MHGTIKLNILQGKITFRASTLYHSQQNIYKNYYVCEEIVKCDSQNKNVTKNRPIYDPDNIFYKWLIDDILNWVVILLLSCTNFLYINHFGY